MLVSDIVAGTVDEFISYALVIVIIMIIWYIIKFFIVAPPTEEEKERKREEEQERFWRGVGKIKEKLVVKKEKKRRKEKASYPKYCLVRAIERSEELDKALEEAFPEEKREAAARKAERAGKELKRELARAARSLKRIRRHEKDKIFQFLNNLYSHSEVAWQKAEGIEIPRLTLKEKEWSSQVSWLQREARVIKSICGSIIEKLDTFVEEAEAEGLGEAAYETLSREEKMRRREEAAAEEAREKREERETAGREEAERGAGEKMGAAREKREAAGKRGPRKPRNWEAERTTGAKPKVILRRRS